MDLRRGELLSFLVKLLVKHLGLMVCSLYHMIWENNLHLFHLAYFSGWVLLRI